MNPEQGWVERARKNAAIEAVKQITDGFVVGLGSGSTAAFAIKEIGRRIKNEGLKVLAVPTSYQAFMLAVKHRIPITTLAEYPTLDITIDGADQIDDKINLIKGLGGAFAREKIVASASKRLIIVVDINKRVRVLGENNHPVPIEVLSFSLSFVTHQIEELGGKPVIREGKGKVGPIITDNGNFIIDAYFGLINSPLELEDKLKKIPGIVETGLFVKMPDTVFIGKRSTVEKIEVTR